MIWTKFAVKNGLEATMIGAWNDNILIQFDRDIWNTRLRWLYFADKNN